MQTSFVAVNFNTVAWLLLDIFPSLSFSFLPNLVPPIFCPRSSRGLRKDFFSSFSSANLIYPIFFGLLNPFSIWTVISPFYLDFYIPFRLGLSKSFFYISFYYCIRFLLFWLFIPIFIFFDRGLVLDVFFHFTIAEHMNKNNTQPFAVTRECYGPRHRRCPFYKKESAA